MSPAFDYDGVADLYDAYVRFDEDIPFFLDACRSVDGLVLELMSGTGRVSIPLIEAGVKLTCIDFSREMLGVLQDKLEKRNLSAQVLQEDVARMRLPPAFDLVFIPFHSFAELAAKEDQRAALHAIFDTLTKGGRFICTLHNPRVRLKSIIQGPATVIRCPLEGDEGEILLKADMKYDADEKLVHGLQILEVFDKAGKRTTERKIAIRFALIEPSALEAMARDAGFEKEELYGDYQRSGFSPESSPYMIWFLRKP